MDFWVEGYAGPLKPFVDIFLSYLFTTGPYILVSLAIGSLLSKLVQKQWVFWIAEHFGQFRVVRYMLLPFLSLFALTNPACYEIGSALKERHKPAFYDAAVSFCHPVTGLFPFSNSGEIFFLIGALYPVIKLGIPVWQFAIAYFVIGLVVIMIKALMTEYLTQRFLNQLNQAKRGE
ncbi:PTS sorbitol transporter subunit IIC [Paenibacillus darwinianus]|uniref:PTS sorbitol transporter subunit IIC n=1 Tax=Paenibacillus darwinianus TaxID=1380763 RepID=A0A9W5W6P9_9BACL|nr:PTS glucitol/sorbitol transporter subunit IIC [Paenibacillus darwinianus]EXX85361.1 PTS sorbitol transporter subunit IIC [Paenibacillus darwinianus]EXX85718.1 PTS sorbitol transporter subunit IIC [Paenibacillus darwinianus]EXX85744.1 PTS sorbitol transporter subunit IIC [Paenibacillus darwinianus]